MVEINPRIFKKYDIRGKAMGDAPDLTPEIAHEIGRGIGTFFQRISQKNTAVVGRDNRLTSYDLQNALMKGIISTGCKVIDIGLVSTPIVYWHVHHYGGVGGVMVTGSHLTSEYNGFKISVGKRNVYGNQLQTILKFITDENFAFGRSEIEVDQSTYGRYTRDLLGRITMERSLKVVIDPGNGTGGLFAPRLFEQWDHDVIGIFIEPNGNFPNHLPNPQEPANMEALSAKVKEVEADIGIAFDGDADRMGAVDEQGNMIAADRILALLARDMIGRNPGAAVVGDVLCSQVLFDAVRDAGGKPIMAASGHSIVKKTMQEEKALLAGEMSGHIFMGEGYLGFDDGYFTAGRLLQLLSNSEMTLSELDNSLPRLYSTPEYRPHCPDEDKQTVIQGIAERLQDRGEVNTVDGIRLQFEEGWGLLRASNTEPVLSLRFEAETEDAAHSYREIFLDALKQFPQVEKIEV